MLINGRGDPGRTNMYTQTDMTFTHRFFLNERITFLFSAQRVSICGTRLTNLIESVALIAATTSRDRKRVQHSEKHVEVWLAAMTLSQGV
jgi:hypothetical protein